MRCPSLASLLAACALASSAARAEVRGVVEVSGLAPIGLAVAPLVGPPGEAEDLRARLVGHLERSHWFSLVAPSGLPSLGAGAPPVPAGASFVVAATVRRVAGAFELDGSIFAADGSRQLGRRYRGAGDQAPQVLRRFADDVVEELTGFPGVASTRVAFVAQHAGRPALFSVAPDGGEPTRLAAGDFECLFPRFGPTGDWLSYTAYPRGFPELMLLEVASGANRSLSARPGLNSLGAISPSGAQVAATLSFEGNPELYLLDLEGRVQRRLTTHRASDLAPTWSPDGRQLAFVSDRAGAPAIYLLDLAGDAGPRRLTHAFDSTGYAVEPAFSPQGDYLAFAGRGAQDLDVWVLRLADGVFFRVSEGGGDEEAPEWAPDNRHLVVATRRGGRRRLEVLDVRNPRNRYEVPLPGMQGLRDPTWSPRLPEPGRTP